MISFCIRPVASSTSVFCVFCRHFSNGQSPVVKWQWNRASHDVSEFLILQYFLFLRQKRENVDGPTVVYPWGLRNCVGDDSKYPGQGDYHEGSTAEVAVCVRLTNSTKAPNTNLQNLFWSHNILSMWVTMSWRQAVRKGTAERTPSFICRITIGSVSTS